MKDNIPRLKWQCIGESVRGASHVRSGLPNQDAIKWYPESGIDPSVILAVSDGHGSAKSFRSDRGSRFAVETAIRIIQEFFLSSQPSEVNFSALKDAAESILPQRLVNEWRKTINEDLGFSENDQEKSTNQSNFTDEEKQILVQKDGEAAWQAVENNHFLAYGATLLAILITESFIVYIQLGDGDILEVDSKGNTTRPLERDPNLIGNETTSLCMNKAWNEIQVHVELYPKGTTKEMPALILVATDGYSNSFSTDEGFFKIGQDYRQMFKSNLIEEIGQKLEGFLRETSEKGSGDDITLGIIKRLEKDDRDYLLDRIENLDKHVGETRESVMKQHENSSGLESQIKRLDKHQKKIDNKVLLVILGLIVTLPLSVISTVLSVFLFFRLDGVKAELSGQQQTDNDLKLEISRIKKEQRAAKNASR